MCLFKVPVGGLWFERATIKKLEIDAAELRIRAERRLGELLDPSKEKRGGSKSRTAALREAGVTKDLSSRAQKLAAVPDPVFEEKLARISVMSLGH